MKKRLKINKTKTKNEDKKADCQLLGWKTLKVFCLNIFMPKKRKTQKYLKICNFMHA